MTTPLTVGDLSARHLGTRVTVQDFHRQGRVHTITGLLEDVWHLSEGRMSNVILREWATEPPLGRHVAPFGHWMCRQEQPMEVRP